MNDIYSDIENDDIEAADADDRLWGTIAHLSTLLPLPLFNLLGPIIVMMAKGGESFFIRKQAVAALNFQFTIIIAYIVCIPFVFVLVGIPMMWIVGLCSMIFACIAGIKAFDGRSFSYPFSIRFMS